MIDSELKRALILVTFLLLAAGCSQHRHDNLNATLWVQTSAEYRASSIQTFEAASRTLEQALDDRSWTAALEQTDAFADRPPAIVLDVDETLLDNSRYQGELILRRRHEFDPDLWDRWIAERRAPLLPGVNILMREAERLGVAIVLITNRECRDRSDGQGRCPQELDTIENLRTARLEASVDPESIHLKLEQPGWSSEKKSRREAVAAKYRILMLLGDDLGDFLPDVKRDITVEERAELLRLHAGKFGTKWFMLPNPTYGSWRRILGADPAVSLEAMQ